jgi:hypothetical protein
MSLSAIASLSSCTLATSTGLVDDTVLTRAGGGADDVFVTAA